MRKERGEEFMIRLFNEQTWEYGQIQTGAAGRAAAGASGAEAEGPLGAEAAREGKTGGKPDYDTYECQTCKNRKYKDGSDDPGVSFKAATRISPEKAAAAVRSHEMEHVTRERAKAERENRKVVSQTVTYKTGICPECGRTYIAGGNTRTVTKGQVEEAFGTGSGEVKGLFFDVAA